MDVASAIPGALSDHPAVREVRLGGSRAEGRAHPLSDWDFVIETDDFESIAQALPTLVAPLGPIAAQWDPYSSHACYMLMLPGPTKVDLLFPDQPRDWSDPWIAAPETLESIDHHFWDWILWLEQKAAGGREEVVAKSLGDMHRYLLEPMGATVAPRSIGEALDAYLTVRSEREREFGVHVSRTVEREVLPTLGRGPDAR
jgi:hypothetical protein